MSVKLVWICDGPRCGIERPVGQTAGWVRRSTWDDGTKELHFCPTCQQRGKVWGDK